MITKDHIWEVLKCPSRRSTGGSSSSNTPLKNSNERGSILPLLLLLSIVILVFAGLAIDSAFLTTSKTQQRQLAEYVALESLHTYLQTPGPMLDKVTAVRARAREIAKLNILLGNRISGLTVGPDDLGASTNLTPSGTDGTVYPGIWWYREPTVQAPSIDCPDYPRALGSWSEPFFQYIDLDTYPNCRINGFQANLHFQGSSGIRTTFMRAFGVDVSNESRADAIAATYPRRGIFLVDLSRSSHAETHRPYEASGGSQQHIYFRFSSEYTFRSSISCGGTTAIPAACIPPGSSCDIYGGSVPGLYESIWLSASVPPPPTLGGYDFIRPGARSAGDPPYVHYRNEYQCFDITYTDTRLGNTPLTETYFVDLGRSPPDYVGPEPLASMLRGVNQAYGVMEVASVDGDGLGIIGFDESATIVQRRFPLSAPGSATWNLVRNLTDVDANPQCISDNTVTADVCRARDRFFITRERGNANIAEAVREAHQMLRNAATDQPAENFVMLLSDGMGNCSLGRNCGRLEVDYNNSFADLANIVTTLLVPDDMQFHFLGFGDVSGPHTIVAPSPNQVDSSGRSTACLTEEEARDHSPPLSFADYSTGMGATSFRDALLNNPPGLTFQTDAYGNLSKNQERRFFRPNQLFQLTRDTGGRWVPIRRPCPANIQNALKTACTGMTFSHTSGRPITVTSSVVAGSTIPDSTGRLLCDPEALSRQEQVRQAMSVIVGRSPYIIVE